MTGTDSKDKMKKSRKWHLILFIPLAVVITPVIAFLIYAEFYYHADQTARDALLSDDLVRVSETDYGWFFDGPSEENLLIFYPGAKVEETAYGPVLHQLAGNGLDVCLVKMPLRFAFLDMNKAGSLLKEYDYPHCYVGGHSLGGAMAAWYAAGHDDRLDGVIHLASYSPKELDDHLLEIVIYGTEDRILDRKSLEKGREMAPEHYYEYKIRGGNHAGFGNYGIQSGDGDPLISAGDQQAETVRIIMEIIGP